MGDVRDVWRSNTAAHIVARCGLVVEVGTRCDIMEGRSLLLTIEEGIEGGVCIANALFAFGLEVLVDECGASSPEGCCGTCSTYGNPTSRRTTRIGDGTIDCVSRSGISSCG